MRIRRSRWGWQLLVAPFSDFLMLFVGDFNAKKLINKSNLKSSRAMFSCKKQTLAIIPRPSGLLKIMQTENRQLVRQLSNELSKPKINTSTSTPTPNCLQNTKLFTSSPNQLSYPSYTLCTLPLSDNLSWQTSNSLKLPQLTPSQ